MQYRFISYLIGTRMRRLSFQALMASAMCCVATSVFAEPAFLDLRVKAPIPGQTISAGYFVLRSTDDNPRQLVAVTSPDAGRVEIHSHVNHDGVMHMMKLENVELPASGQVVFEPGGHHLMIFSPSAEAVESGSLSLRFEFDSGEKYDLEAAVESWSESHSDEHSETHRSEHDHAEHHH